jgi:hypothetical protein
MTTSKTFFRLKSLSPALVLIASTSGAFLTTAAMAQTPPPAQNVSPTIHPYLAQAQRFIAQANASIVAAQQAHGFALNGHADQAKRLLDQASAELKAAAITSNGN